MSEFTGITNNSLSTQAEKHNFDNIATNLHSIILKLNAKVYDPFFSIMIMWCPKFVLTGGSVYEGLLTAWRKSKCSFLERTHHTASSHPSKITLKAKNKVRDISEKLKVCIFTTMQKHMTYAQIGKIFLIVKTEHLSTL